MGDLRTAKTYKLLKDALFELLSQKSFDSIKVNDICDLAMVHRTTFYSHFADKYELLDYCINEMEKELISGFSVKDYDSAKDFYTDLVMNILRYFGSNKKFFRNMINNNYSAGIITILHNSAIDEISKILQKQSNSGINLKVPIKIMAEFYSGAVTSIIIWWLQSNSKTTEKELCNYIISLIFDGQRD